MNNPIKTLAVSSMVINTIVLLIGLAGMNPEDLMFPGGVGAGLWLAAGALWLAEPFTS